MLKTWGNEREINTKSYMKTNDLVCKIHLSALFLPNLEKSFSLYHLVVASGQVPEREDYSFPTCLRISFQSEAFFSWMTDTGNVHPYSVASARSEWTWLGPEALWDLQKGEVCLCLGNVEKSEPNPKFFLIITIMTLLCLQHTCQY